MRIRQGKTVYAVYSDSFHCGRFCPAMINKILVGGNKLDEPDVGQTAGWTAQENWVNEKAKIHLNKSMFLSRKKANAKKRDLDLENKNIWDEFNG